MAETCFPAVVLNIAGSKEQKDYQFQHMPKNVNL